LFTALWSLDHIVGEGAHVLVLRFLQRLLGRLDIDLAGRIGDVRDLRIGGLGALRQRRQRRQAQRGERRVKGDTHWKPPL